MAQEIITYTILFVTVVIAIWKIIRFFSATQSKCDACTFSESSCKIAELKKKSNFSGAGMGRFN